MGKAATKLKKLDFYKRLPSDLQEATVTGAWISIAASVIMVVLLVMEFSSFLSTKTATDMVVDRSSSDELIRVTFNISFPALSCEFATVDVSDALGTRRMNITSKTIRKTPLTAEGRKAGRKERQLHSDEPKAVPQYDDLAKWEQADFDIAPNHPIRAENFEKTMQRYAIVVVNFYAPWCSHCQTLEPSWDAATQMVHDRYPEHDGRIRFAKVNCVDEEELCNKHFITAFPSIRVFRKGHDEIYGGIHGYADHETYTGDRTMSALIGFAEALVPSAGAPHIRHDDLVRAPTSAGCLITGYVLMNKVPGVMQIGARDPAHNFNPASMNLTHTVNRFYFATTPSHRKWQVIQRIHPTGHSAEVTDRLGGTSYFSESPSVTHEHYLQVVRTTVEPLNHKINEEFDVYEYIVHSNAFVSTMLEPAVHFAFDMSPIQMVVRELPKKWYHFLTTTCAVIGGVFTVAGIIDSILYAGINTIRWKKSHLGGSAR